jgi:hypothetical protein
VLDADPGDRRTAAVDHAYVQARAALEFDRAGGTAGSDLGTTLLRRCESACAHEDRGRVRQRRSDARRAARIGRRQRDEVFVLPLRLVADRWQGASAPVRARVESSRVQARAGGSRARTGTEYSRLRAERAEARVRFRRAHSRARDRITGFLLAHGDVDQRQEIDVDRGEVEVAARGNCSSRDRFRKRSPASSSVNRAPFRDGRRPSMRVRPFSWRSTMAPSSPRPSRGVAPCSATVYCSTRA